MTGKIIFCLLVFLASILAIRSVLFFSSQKQYKNGEDFYLKTTLFSEPKQLSRGQQLYLNTSNGQGILITLPLTPKVYYGDVLEIKGRLKETKIGENSILALDYPQFSVKYQEQNPVLALASKLRHKIATFYNTNLPSTSSSLLLGIVFGIKENMPKDFSDLLKSSGVTHVIAASGMNISMVGGFFALLFTQVLRRKLALILTIAVIFLYALFSGFEPSIMRASIMGAVAFGAQILGRQNSSILALLMTGFVMLFISPTLIFDVGFQLSFLSTIGILILNPVFSAGFSKIPLLRLIEGDLSTTLSAQIFTLPIILGTFGSYSLISVFVNALVLWTIPILMVLGALGAFLGIVFIPLGVLVLYLSYPFLIYFEFIVRNLGSLGFLVSLETFPITLVIGYYLILSAGVLKLIHKK